MRIERIKTSEVQVGDSIRFHPSDEWCMVAEIVPDAVDEGYFEIIDTEGNGELVDDTESVEVMRD